MDPLDWLLAALLIYSVVRSVIRGFFQEVFALVGLIAGVLLACWFYSDVAIDLKGLINSQQIGQLAAFLLILSATMIVAGLVGRILRRTASAVGLGLIDRLMGALFGLLRGALLGLALLLAATAFLPEAPWIENSHLAPYFLRAAHAVSFVMPSDLRVRLLNGLDRIKHTNPDWIKHGLLSQTRDQA